MKKIIVQALHLAFLMISLLCATSPLQGQWVDMEIKFLGIECINQVDAGESSEIGYELSAHLTSNSGGAEQPFLKKKYGSSSEFLEMGNKSHKNLGHKADFSMNVGIHQPVIEVKITEFDDFGGNDIMSASKIESQAGANHTLKIEVTHPDGDLFNVYYTILPKPGQSMPTGNPQDNTSPTSSGSNVTAPSDNLEEAVKPQNYNKANVEKLLNSGNAVITSTVLTELIKRKDLNLINAAISVDGSAIEASHFSQAMEVGRKDIAKRILSTKMIIPGENELKLVLESGDDLLLKEMIDYHSAMPSTTTLNFAIEKRKTTAVAILLQQVKPNGESYELAAKANDDLMYSDLTMEGRIPNNRSIEIAIDKGNDAILKDGLSNGGDANQALNYALTTKKVKAVNYLLTRSDINPNSALSFAVEQKDRTLFSKLIHEKGADPNQALQHAVDANNTELAVICLQTNNTSPTSRHLISSVEFNNTDLAKKLVEYGADANDGMSPAIVKKNNELVQFFISQGAAVSNPEYIQIAARDNAIVAKMLVEAGADANIGMPIAVSGNETNVVKVLLENGASPDGFISSAAKKGNMVMVGDLLQYGANAQDGMDAAVSIGHLAISSALVQAGADATSPTYMAMAASNGYADLLRFLVRAGASIEYTSASGGTLLHLAVAPKNALNTSSVLLNLGVPIDAQDHEGNTALHLAAMKGRKKVPLAEKLISAGADLSITNNEGETPAKAAKFGKMRRMFKKLK